MINFEKRDGTDKWRMFNTILPSETDPGTLQMSITAKYSFIPNYQNKISYGTDSNIRACTL